MKIISYAMGILSMLTILSMIICGLWMRSHPVDNTSFHQSLGIATLVISLVTIIVMMVTIAHK